MLKMQAIQSGESSRIRSSNYKYLLEVWKVVKSVPHVYAIQKFFRFGPSSMDKRSSNRSQSEVVLLILLPRYKLKLLLEMFVERDISLKISTMDEKRLGHDLVRAQWDELDSSDEDEECNANEDDGVEYVAQIAIAVMARQLVSAASIAEATPILILPYLSHEITTMDYSHISTQLDYDSIVNPTIHQFSITLRTHQPQTHPTSLHAE